MTTADFRHGPRLLLLLQGALAVGATGCVSGEEVVSVPWRAAEHHLVLGEAVSAQTCRAICLQSELLLLRGGRAHLGSDKCELTRVEMSNVGRPRSDVVARVSCAAHDARVRPPYRVDRTYQRRLPGDLLDRAVEGRLVPLETETCRRLCLPTPPDAGGQDVAFEDACSILPVVPAAPISSERVFVVCTYEPNHDGISPDGPYDLSPPPDPRYQGTPSLMHLPSGRVPASSAAVRSLASEREFAVWSAYYEALSIAAFQRLARDLREHGAPSKLVAEARSFARDEARHTRAWLAVALSEQDGVEARRRLRATWPARTPPPRKRSIGQLALDNAVEGCIGESYGAWLAAHQAEHATSVAIQRTAERIAHDEAEHAAFSFRLHDWLRPRLSAPQTRRLQRAAQRALDALGRPLPMPSPVASSVGAPSAARHAALAEPLQALLAAGLRLRGSDA